MRGFLLLLLLCLLPGCYNQTPEEEERERKLKEEERLSDEVKPIMKDYFEYCYEGNVGKIFEFYSNDFLENQQVLLGQDKWLNEGRKERPTRKQLQEIGVSELQAFYEKKKTELKMIAETAQVKSVKRHGHVFAIVEVEYVKGNEYLAMIRQDDTWKIHRRNPSRFILISNLLQ